MDFAITLEPSEITSAAFRNLDPMPHRSFNQTTLNTIANRPIALSIETKSQSGSSDEARVQLAVWALSQFKRLELLLNENSQLSKEERALPALPLLSFEGSLCRLFAASKDELGSETGVLWDCGALGTMDTVRGIYQIIHALQLLMRWAQLEYRPWFERTAAPLLPEERAHLLSKIQ